MALTGFLPKNSCSSWNSGSEKPHEINPFSWWYLMAHFQAGLQMQLTNLYYMDENIRLQSNWKFFVESYGVLLKMAAYFLYDVYIMLSVMSSVIN